MFSISISYFPNFFLAVGFFFFGLSIDLSQYIDDLAQNIPGDFFL